MGFLFIDSAEVEDVLRPEWNVEDVLRPEWNEIFCNDKLRANIHMIYLFLICMY